MRKKLLAALLVLIALAGGSYFLLGRLLVSDLMRTELERQLSAHLQQPVSIKTATAALFPRVALQLSDVVVGNPPAIGLSEVRVATGLRPLLARRFEQAEVRLSHGHITLPLRFTLTPAVGPAVSESSFVLASIQSIELRDITVSSGGQAWNVDADCAVVGDRLDVARLSAMSSTTALKASGALTSISRVEGEFAAQADTLGVDELLAFGSGLSRPVEESGAASVRASTPLRVVVKLTAAAGRLAGYDFRGLSTTAAMTSSGILLSPLTVTAFGGTFDGRLDVNTARSSPAMQLSGRVDALDLATVLQAAGSQGGVTGALGGTVSLAASGTETQSLLRSARGRLAATVINGTMPHLDVVRPIVLAFGKPSGAPPAGSGSSFTRLGGTFALAEGTMTSDDVAMASRDFDLAGRGTLHLASGAISARADVVLSAELTSQAGTDLRRYAQQDGRVVVPATFGGTMQRPTVSLDVAAATRRALTNELERRTRSLIDDLFKRKR